MATKKLKKPPQKNRPQPTPPPLTPWPLTPSLTPKELLHRFRGLFSDRLLARWLKTQPKAYYQRAFTPLITLWYCVFQRLSPDHTLSNALADALEGGADRLSPRGKPLSQQLHSSATTSLSDARQRLPGQFFHLVLTWMAQQIRSWAGSVLWLGWQVILLDGSTIRLRPFGDIPSVYPPHLGSRRKKGYWCLLRVIGGFCLTTGLLMGSTYGPMSVSEQVLAAQFILQALPQSLFIGDRNLGVFSVVQAARQAQSAVLLRLTKVRARRMARMAKVRLHNGLDTPLFWTHSSHDQLNPKLSCAPVQGRLLALKVRRSGSKAQMLYLFTTLTDVQTYSLESLVQLYGTRWQVELDLRFVKAQMQLGALECKSADMAHKEWLAGLIGYNLIRSVMVAAAAQRQLPVGQLSFSRTRQLFQHWLIRWAWRSRGQDQSWMRLLQKVAKCVHPRRKPRLSEPRALRPYQKPFPKLYGDRAIARKRKFSRRKN